MKRLFKKIKHFTLTEALVGAIIIATLFGGLLATFVSSRGYINRANKRLDALNLARSQLLSLNNDVREDTWNTGNLSVGTHNLSIPYPYTGNYIVTDHTDYREVRININYPLD